MINWLKKIDVLKGKPFVFIGIILICVILDQVTKQLANQTLVLYQQNVVFPGFNWTLMYNKGAAFSFLADQGGWQRWFFTIISTVISIVLIFWIKREIPKKPLIALSFSLILAGAIGNLIDRSIYGHVIDFIQVHYQEYYWPAFNIADSVIFIGVVLLLIESVFMQNKQ